MSPIISKYLTAQVLLFVLGIRMFIAFRLIFPTTSNVRNKNIWSVEKSFDGIYEDHESNGLNDELRYYREYVKRGMKRFMDRDFAGATADFDRARGFNGTQPLIQRGISLYCIGDYEASARQFSDDIKIFEGTKMIKASDLRLWKSACYNKLGKFDDALEALDLSNKLCYGHFEQRYIINNTLHFFGQERSIDDMLEIIGNADERDFTGVRFFGNFYLGLYYASINVLDLSLSFLDIPSNSFRYPNKDMWFHLPRVMRDVVMNQSALIMSTSNDT